MITGARPASPAAVLLEVGATTLAVLLVIRLVVQTLSGVLWDLPLAIVPVLFMWAPVWVLRARGVDPDRYPLAIPWFDERDAWWSALRLCGVAVLAIAPPYLLIYHLWHTSLFPDLLATGCDLGVRSACGVATSEGPAWRFPSDLAKLVGYHLFFVAIPEELYYRGYVQSRLDEVWRPRWRVLGATVGPAWLATSLIFAFGHSLVLFQWWHFAIFFPSLVFGWMRARSGGILAGAFFHAWSNVTVGILDVVYGLQPP